MTFLHVKNAYQKLKEEHKPQSAQEMWELFIADVMRRKIEAEQTDMAWEWPEPATF